MRQKLRQPGNAIGQLIWQSRRAIKFSIDADRRDDRIRPAITEGFPDTTRMAKLIGHRQRMAHRWLINCKRSFPLLKNVMDQPLGKFQIFY